MLNEKRVINEINFPLKLVNLRETELWKEYMYV